MVVTHGPLDSYEENATIKVGLTYLHLLMNYPYRKYVHALNKKIPFKGLKLNLYGGWDWLYGIFEIGWKINNFSVECEMKIGWKM